MSIGKLCGWPKVRAAAAHNLREIPVGADEHIDAARTRFNYVLVGPERTGAVARQALQRMADEGIDTTKPRKNGVTALEVLHSLPVGSLVPHRAYFEACVAWTGQRFGGAANIVSAIVHMDEAAQHCHIILAPILEGRMQGSDMVGGIKELAEHQLSFFAAVASKFGFSKPTKLTASQKQATAKAVIQHLRNAGDQALKSALWANFRKAIEAAPQSFAEALGVDVAPAKEKKLRTLTQTMIGPGKGPKREAASVFPIGVRTKPYRDSDTSLSRVGNVPGAASLTVAGAGHAQTARPTTQPAAAPPPVEPAAAIGATMVRTFVNPQTRTAA
ncbi:MAG: plasmid recombination protein [Rubrivivax sp.]|nr:plasmid recombination protein [Rubrivivax sp.]